MWGRVLTRRRSVSAAQDCIRRPRKSRDFHGELSPTAGDTKILLGQNVRWLCWQSDSNPSLPAKLEMQGSFVEMQGAPFVLVAKMSEISKC